MKKLVVVLLMIVFTIFVFSKEVLPVIETSVINGKNYVIKIDYTERYNQAVFTYICLEDLFHEEVALRKILDQIEIFQKEKGYYGFDISTDQYFIRIQDEKIKYSNSVIFRKINSY